MAAFYDGDRTFNITIIDYNHCDMHGNAIGVDVTADALRLADLHTMGDGGPYLVDDVDYVVYDAMDYKYAEGPYAYLQDQADRSPYNVDILIEETDMYPRKEDCPTPYRVYDRKTDALIWRTSKKWMSKNILRMLRERGYKSAALKEEVI